MVSERRNKIGMKCVTRVLSTIASPVCLVVLLCASAGAPSHAGESDVMKEIEDGGIYCRSSNSAIDGFYAYAAKTCKGKKQCVVRATKVASKAMLLSHGCTGFFVAPVCDTEPVNIETHDVLGRLSVSCSP